MSEIMTQLNNYSPVTPQSGETSETTGTNQFPTNEVRLNWFWITYLIE